MKLRNFRARGTVGLSARVLGFARDIIVMLLCIGSVLVFARYRSTWTLCTGRGFQGMLRGRLYPSKYSHIVINLSGYYWQYSKLPT